MPVSGVILNPQTFPEQPSFPAPRRATILAGGVIVLAAIAAYHNSFSVPFVFDDARAITGNLTIRQLWPIGPVLSPPANLTVGGRPLVNLSFALNYATSGTDVWSYHALNLAVHILAGLTLFGIVRRTLLQPCLRGRFGPEALPLALAVALLWILHPLQTESVTYVVQRTESLMGLFYLLTMYCFIRGADCHVLRDNGNKRPSESNRLCHLLSDKPPGVLSGIWFALSVLACLLGMASKEVMVSAPLMVLLYDRTFVGGSFREAWKQRGRLYLGLGATWLLLGWLVVRTGTRGGTAGFGSGVVWWAYALTQFRAVGHYLWLSVWPHPLVLDYGTALARQAVEVVPYALVVTLLVGGTVAGLRRRSAIGFAGAWVFAILAPTSSLVPVATQTMAEHRMYLPLAAVIALAVIGIHAGAGRRSGIVYLMLAVGLGWLTVRRNEDYRSELAIWSDTVAKCPGNARAHFTLGNVYSRMERLPEAMDQYAAVLRLDPHHAEAHNGLGNILVRLERVAEAMTHYERALQLEPDYLQADYNYGNALVQAGRLPEAMKHYEHALRLDPQNAEVRNNLGSALLLAGRTPEAIGQYEQALRIKPDYAEAHYNLANALAQVEQLQEAIAHYEQALQIKPDYVEARDNLARVRMLQRAAPPRD